MEKPPYYVNAHAHCFTINHVPDNFTKTLTWFSWLLRIKWIKRKKIIRWLIVTLNKKWILALISRALPAFTRSLPRLMNFAENFDVDAQKKMIQGLQAFYPDKTKLVFLTMDMEFMAAGKPLKNFHHQLDELAECKRDPALKDIIYPFVFADPRRDKITEIVRARLEDQQAPFAGIKIYPALGYYPFDERLRDTYQYALDHNTPVLTHCIKGVVYYRGKKTDHTDYMVHPITKKTLPFRRPVDFTASFTHPYNYECLLNYNILKNYWKEPIDLKNLKICLGHFGGEDEWLKYMQDAWLLDRDFNIPEAECLELFKNEWYDKPPTRKSKGLKAYSWFSVIREMIRKYDNVYADISYTLCEPRILPLLKALLESPDRISKRILFGTDYFVVSKAGAEREMSLYVRGYLGDRLWNKIAYENPNEFLNL